MRVVIIINTSIFLLLSLLHFYWVFNGKWGIDAAIPSKFGSTYFDPKNKFKNKLATLIVALALIGFSIITVLNISMPGNVQLLIATRIIGSIFIIRAIGDFNILGMFKKKSDSKFARYDTKIFVPLCAYIGISTILISLF